MTTGVSHNPPNSGDSHSQSVYVVRKSAWHYRHKFDVVINLQPNCDRKEGREDRRKEGKERGGEGKGRGGERREGKGRWMSPLMLEVPLILAIPHVTLLAVPAAP